MSISCSIGLGGRCLVKLRQSAAAHQNWHASVWVQDQRMLGAGLHGYAADQWCVSMVFGRNLELVHKMRLTNLHYPLLGVVQNLAQAMIAPGVKYQRSIRRYDPKRTVDQAGAKIYLGNHVKTYIFER